MSDNGGDWGRHVSTPIIDIESDGSGSEFDPSDIDNEDDNITCLLEVIYTPTPSSNKPLASNSPSMDKPLAFSTAPLPVPPTLQIYLLSHVLHLLLTTSTKLTQSPSLYDAWGTKVHRLYYLCLLLLFFARFGGDVSNARFMQTPSPIFLSHRPVHGPLWLRLLELRTSGKWHYQVFRYYSRT